MPRRVFGRGIAEHVVDGSLVELPLFAVSPVLGGDFPLLFGRALSGAEALQLFLLTDMNPEFHQQSAALLQIGLKVVDFPVGAPPVRLAAEALNPLDEDATVPGAVKNRNVAALREPLVEAPEEVAFFLFRRRARNRERRVAAGVERRGETLNAAALSRGVPAFKADNQRDASGVEKVLIFGEPCSLCFQAFFVLLPRERLT